MFSLDSCDIDEYTGTCRYQVVFLTGKRQLFEENEREFGGFYEKII